MCFSPGWVVVVVLAFEVKVIEVKVLRSRVQDLKVKGPILILPAGREY